MTLAQADVPNINPKPRQMRWFLVGALVGVFVGGEIATIKLGPNRTPEDEAIYDRCLAKNGSKVKCDALMRMLERDNEITAQWKKKVDEFRAAGYSERDIVDWIRKQNITGSRAAEVLGMTFDQYLSYLRKEGW